MQLNTVAPGQHAWFFRAGDAITVAAAGGSVNGAATNSNKPDPSDPLYIWLGQMNDWEDDIKGSDIEIWGPSPGRMQLTNIIENKVKAMSKFTTQQMGALAAEIFYRNQAEMTSATAQFNKLSGTARQGWLHMQRYDQNNAVWLTEDQWCILRITGGVKSKEGAIIEPTWEAITLYSLLNSSAC
ncbi:MAG TPA: hypothetical protein VHY30_01570 [Verrucomicrobiae bacterium]|jgi:hypothetical protein|nr:hypothetical protein [Verrucomicrobiae bacterium]